MARPDLLPDILPALSADTVRALLRDLSGSLAATDRPTSAAAKAMGCALAVIRAGRRDVAGPDAGASS